MMSLESGSPFAADLATSFEVTSALHTTSATPGAHGGGGGGGSSGGAKKLQYRSPRERRRVMGMVEAPEFVTGETGSVARPNSDEILKRVSVVILKHIAQGERRKVRVESSARSGTVAALSTAAAGTTAGILSFARQTTLGAAPSMSEAAAQLVGVSIAEAAKASAREALETSHEFDAARFATAEWRYTFLLGAPMLSPLITYALSRKVERPEPPTVQTINRFLRHIFAQARLNPECSIICLIYVERLMQKTSLSLLYSNWKPVMLCGVLLASKVWDDHTPWNVEFALILPEFSVKSINSLERTFVEKMQWNLYISAKECVACSRFPSLFLPLRNALACLPPPPHTSVAGLLSCLLSGSRPGFAFAFASHRSD